MIGEMSAEKEEEVVAVEKTVRDGSASEKEDHVHTSVGSDDTNDSDSDVSISMAIRASAVGLLIGKSGQTLNAMTNQSGAMIKFHEVEDTSKNKYKERCVVITGGSKNVCDALRLIMLRLQSQLSTRAKNVETDSEMQLIQWAIPQAAAGLLIGKQGAGIKHINERSGSWVKIAHPEESLVSGERIVYIRGSKSQTALALEIVKKVAGGRPLVEDEREAFCIQMRLPRRSTDSVLRGFISEDENSTEIDYIMEKFSAVRIKLEKHTFTGLSETVANIYCEDPMERAEAVKLIESRLISWQSTYISPEITPRTARSEGGAGKVNTSPTNVEKEAGMHSEMSIVLLVSKSADENLIFPETVGTPDANVFNDLLARYGCTMSKSLLDTEPASPRDRFKRLLITGSLRSLSRCTVKISEKMRKKFPDMVLELEDPNKARHGRAPRGGGGFKLPGRMDPAAGGFPVEDVWRQGAGGLPPGRDDGARQRDTRDWSRPRGQGPRSPHRGFQPRFFPTNEVSMMDGTQPMMGVGMGMPPGSPDRNSGMAASTDAAPFSVGAMPHPAAPMDAMYGGLAGTTHMMMAAPNNFSRSNDASADNQPMISPPTNASYFVSPPGSPVGGHVYHTGQDRRLYYYLAQQQQAQQGTFYFPAGQGDMSQYGPNMGQGQGQGYGQGKR